MNRRDLLRFSTLYVLPSVCGCLGYAIGRFPGAGAGLPEDFAEVHGLTSSHAHEHAPTSLNDPGARSAYFLRDFPDDIFFADRKFELLKSLAAKFRAVQGHVGYGYFNILGMDDFFGQARSMPGMSAITAEEKTFLEDVFYFDAKKYGFQGDRTAREFTDEIAKNSVEKVPFTGHYLRKGRPLETYGRIIKDVGDSVILTSGVRGLAKQFHLFFERGLETEGNMSKASRSLAPPGYSFHGQSDFDIGKRGYGLKNFTDEFASTGEYRRLLDLGYIQIRYTERNHLGVRFEPWHIRVTPG